MAYRDTCVCSMRFAASAVDVRFATPRVVTCLAPGLLPSKTIARKAAAVRLLACGDIAALPEARALCA
jgi:hypothetical protein